MILYIIWIIYKWPSCLTSMKDDIFTCIFLSVVQTSHHGQKTASVLSTEIFRGYTGHWSQGCLPKCDGRFTGIYYLYIFDLFDESWYSRWHHTILYLPFTYLRDSSPYPKNNVTVFASVLMLYLVKYTDGMPMGLYNCAYLGNLRNYRELKFSFLFSPIAFTEAIMAEPVRNCS